MKIADVRKLVGNPDVYARQYENGTWAPVDAPLDDDALLGHLWRNHTIGTYVVWGDKARTLVFDIDTGDLNMAKLVQTVLRKEFKLASCIEDSGRKGYHVWMVVDEFMSAADLRRLGDVVKVEVEFPAMEVFPKQNTVKNLGNLVKLPGGVHRVTGKPCRLIDGEKLVVNTRAEVEAALKTVPMLTPTSRGHSADLGLPCMENILAGEAPEGVRDIALAHLQGKLRYLLGDSNSALHVIAAAVNEANDNMAVPLDRAEIDALLKCETGPMCEQLPPGLHCGDACPRNRVKRRG